MFYECFKCLKTVLRMVLECLRSVLRVVQECFKRVLKMLIFQEFFLTVLRVFMCFRTVKRVAQEFSRVFYDYI